MHAHPGDHLVVAPAVVGQPVREGEVLEAHGPEDGPPFLVRWSDGHVGLFHPAPGAGIKVTPSGDGHGAVADGSRAG